MPRIYPGSPGIHATGRRHRCRHYPLARSPSEHPLPNPRKLRPRFSVLNSAVAIRDDCVNCSTSRSTVLFDFFQLSRWSNFYFNKFIESKIEQNHRFLLDIDYIVKRSINDASYNIAIIRKNQVSCIFSRPTTFRQFSETFLIQNR